MTWLNGIPRSVRTLQSPVDVEDARQLIDTSTTILDNEVARTRRHLLADGSSMTTIYLADLGENINPVLFRKVGEIPLRLSQVELLPGDEPKFASFEWNEAQSTVILRTHSKDGSIIKEHSTHAAAVYGNLVVHQSTLALCISSGNPPNDGLQHLLSDYKANSTFVADQIVVWDTTQNLPQTINIPQNPECPMLHSAQFRFISPTKIALAGCVESTYGMDAALLKCFSVSNNEYVRTFAQWEHTDRDLIRREMHVSGSSKHSDIVVHAHDDTRLSIFHKSLVTGDVTPVPTKHIHMDLQDAAASRSHHRVLTGRMNGSASLSGNRILVVGEKVPELDFDPVAVAQILDFDRQRVEDLASLDTAGRNDLSAALEGDGARVKVITRRFNIDAYDEEVDGEYPYPEPSRPEWNEHLRRMYIESQARLEAGRDPPALEYDEPPAEHRSEQLFGFVESEVKIQQDVDPRCLTIAASALIYIPHGGDQQDWLVFDFEE